MTAEDTDDIVSRVARAIVDKRSVLWDEVRKGADSSDRATLDALQAISRHVCHQDAMAPTPLRPDRWGHLHVLGTYREGTPLQFLARDDTAGQAVILTLIGPLGGNQRRTEQLLRETRRRTIVHHPNLASIYGADYAQDYVGYRGQYVSGRTLREVTDQAATIDVNRACEIVLDLCGAIVAMHTAGLMHGNITAGQVVQTADNRIILLGSGCNVSDVSSDDEALAAAIERDVRDLGALLWWLLRSTGASVAEPTLTRTYQQLPRAVAAFLERCAPMSPTGQFTNIREFESALRVAINPVRVSPEWIVGAIAVILLTALVFWLSLTRRVA